MNFNDAVKGLREGKFIAREAWIGKCNYIASLPAMPHFWNVTTQPQPNANVWMPLKEDILGEDWEVYDHPEISQVMAPVIAEVKTTQ